MEFYSHSFSATTDGRISSSGRSSASLETRSKPVYFNPQSCLRILAEQGHVYDVETSEMIDDEHPEFRQRRWRTEVWEARKSVLKGIGEAPRKLLAKQAAILDAMETLREESSGGSPPPHCKIPKGSQISPFIVPMLQNLCHKRKLWLSDFETNLVNIRGRDKYKTTILVGDKVFTGTSYDDRFSKYIVAMNAYNELSDEEFQLDTFYTGVNNCLDNDAFALVEVEENHIVHAKPGAYMPSCVPTQSASVSAKKRPFIEASITPPLSPRLTQLRKVIAQRKLEETGHGWAVPEMIVGKRPDVGSNASLDSTDTSYKEKWSLRTLEKTSSATAGKILRIPTFQSGGPTKQEEQPKQNSNEDLFLTVEKSPDRWNFVDLYSPQKISPPTQILSFAEMSKQGHPPCPLVTFDGKDWKTQRETILENIKVFGEHSDDEEESDQMEGESMSLVVVGTGFGERMKSADLASKKNFGVVVTNISESLNNN